MFQREELEQNHRAYAVYRNWIWFAIIRHEVQGGEWSKIRLMKKVRTRSWEAFDTTLR